MDPLNEHYCSNWGNILRRKYTRGASFAAQKLPIWDPASSQIFYDHYSKVAHPIAACMKSNVPVKWYPCGPHNSLLTHATYLHSYVLLQEAKTSLISFLIVMLKKSATTVESRIRPWNRPDCFETTPSVSSIHVSN